MSYLRESLPETKKKRKKEKNWNFKFTAHFFVMEIQQETKLTSHTDSY